MFLFLCINCFIVYHLINKVSAYYSRILIYICMLLQRFSNADKSRFSCFNLWLFILCYDVFRFIPVMQVFFVVLGWVYRVAGEVNVCILDEVYQLSEWLSEVCCIVIGGGTGVWGVGVATRSCDVQQVPLGCDSNSWVLRHDGSLYHNNTELCRLTTLPEEGDVIVSVVPSTLFVSRRAWCLVISRLPSSPSPPNDSVLELCVVWLRRQTIATVLYCCLSHLCTCTCDWVFKFACCFGFRSPFVFLYWAFSMFCLG